MIIPRKYEYIWRLIERDPQAKKVYENACAFQNNEEWTQKIYEYNLGNKPYRLELGCGIIDPFILWNGLDELDISHPYDNGFSVNDINDIEIIYRSDPGDWGRETEHPAWIQYAFICRFDGWEHIVKLEKITE